MHELSIVFGIVEIATEACKKKQKSNVKTIGLEIGCVSGIQMEALDFVWPVAVKGSVLEKATRDIQTIPGQAMCLECSESFDIASLYDNCPACGSYFKNIISGKELKVKYLEV